MVCSCQGGRAVLGEAMVRCYIGFFRDSTTVCWWCFLVVVGLFILKGDSSDTRNWWGRVYWVAHMCCTV